LSHAPDKQTNKQTDSNNLPTLTNSVGVGNYTQHIMMKQLDTGDNDSRPVSVHAEDIFSTKFDAC